MRHDRYSSARWQGSQFGCRLAAASAPAAEENGSLQDRNAWFYDKVVTHLSGANA